MKTFTPPADSNTETINAWAKANGVTLTVTAEPEDCAIEGNASAIDPETDAATVAMIREQLERGNEWAWCCIAVSACHDSTGIAARPVYLGCCSYASREEFIGCQGYYNDMAMEAIEALCDRLNSIALAIA